MKQSYNRKTLFFNYNEVKDKNFTPNFDIKKFCQRLNIAVEFITYILNFKIMAKPNLIFNYNLRFYKIYLIVKENQFQ